jgi:hypothetical protein
MMSAILDRTAPAVWCLPLMGLRRLERVHDYIRSHCGSLQHWENNITKLNHSGGYILETRTSTSSSGGTYTYTSTFTSASPHHVSNTRATQPHASILLQPDCSSR